MTHQKESLPAVTERPRQLSKANPSLVIAVVCSLVGAAKFVKRRGRAGCYR
jgi:hypothetical protein